MQGYDFSFCTGGKRLDAQFHEFHISAECRRRCGFEAPLFASSGNVILAGIKNARVFIQKYNASLPPGAPPNMLKPAPIPMPTPMKAPAAALLCAAPSSTSKLRTCW